MSKVIKNVAIAGAAGNLGATVLAEFLKTPEFNVSVITRADSTATFPHGVKVHKTNYTKDELADVLKGQDAVLSLISFSSAAAQRALIDASVEAGVTRFFPNEFGHPPGYRNIDLLPPPFPIKDEILDYLKQKESSGLSWTAVITGAFFDMVCFNMINIPRLKLTKDQGIKQGWLGFDTTKHSARIWDDGNVRFSANTLRQIARGLVKACQHPEETANRAIFIASFTTTNNEVLAALEKASGKKWDLVKVDSEKEIADGQEKRKNGDFTSSMAQNLCATWYTEGKGADFEKGPGLDNEKLGLPLEDLEQVCRVIVA